MKRTIIGFITHITEIKNKIYSGNFLLADYESLLRDIAFNKRLLSEAKKKKTNLGCFSVILTGLLLIPIYSVIADILTEVAIYLGSGAEVLMFFMFCLLIYLIPIFLQPLVGKMLLSRSTAKGIDRDINLDFFLLKFVVKYKVNSLKKGVDITAFEEEKYERLESNSKNKNKKYITIALEESFLATVKEKALSIVFYDFTEWRCVERIERYSRSDPNCPDCDHTIGIRFSYDTVVSDEKLLIVVTDLSPCGTLRKKKYSSFYFKLELSELEKIDIANDIVCSLVDKIFYERAKKLIDVDVINNNSVKYNAKETVINNNKSIKYDTKETIIQHAQTVSELKLKESIKKYVRSKKI